MMQLILSKNCRPLFDHCYTEKALNGHERPTIQVQFKKNAI